MRPNLLLLLAASLALSQGVATRSVQPTPRHPLSSKPFPARLTDIARQAGLTRPVLYGPEHHKNYILEATGSGVAFFDYDNDGWLDILLLSGTRFDENLPAGAATNRLYRNLHNGAFVEVTKQAGLERSGWASSVSIADIDNDGFDDVFITCWGQNILYRNRGNGAFEDITASAGLLRSERLWGAGATFLDYDRDGHLDLFIANYLDFDPAKVPRPGQTASCAWKGIPVNCGPRGLPKARPLLYKGDGKGHFKEVTAQSGIAKAEPGYGMTAVAADFDSDGWTDLYLASDSTPSLLFLNQRNGVFLERGLEQGVAVSEDGMEQAGMGIALGDFNRDGLLDILKTNFWDDTPNLYRNLGAGQFIDEALKAGLGVETRFIGWGAGMPDLDNDGWPDLFISTGSVFPEVESKLPSYPFLSPRLLFRNLGNGRFEQLTHQAGPALSALHSSRGAAFGDFDNDGDLDILIMNMNQPPSLLRNDLPRNTNWLKVHLQGTKSNRSAIGATVIATFDSKPLAQAVTAQSSFYSVDDRRLHFGLGASTSANIEIRWPSGDIEKLQNVKAGQFVTIREGSGIVRSQKLP
ncbi:MAG: CRTAC1 family protein [Acidobacteria bacterium]|nr:CRTAC1 family protein [Acidobacteriota bacterium]